MTTFDYSDSDNLIPDGTIATVLTRSSDGGSEYLDCEFVVIEGPYAKRKFWDRFMLVGTTDKHVQWIDKCRGTLKGILDSAFDLDPADKSEKARARRTVEHRAFDGLNFPARIGIEKGRPKNNGTSERWDDKNVLAAAIMRGDKDWKGPTPQPPPFNGGNGGAGATLPLETPPPSKPASGIPKPEWAT